ncbi:MAG: gamma-glutamyl-gamma-aminobutyrate hydrolase family protein [Planctomycetota bacterium]
MAKPVIGINANLTKDGSDHLHQDYSRAVIKAGGLPLILPVVPTTALVKALLKKVDGLILSGSGYDINPHTYGEKKMPQTKWMPPAKEFFDLTLVRLALRKKIPLLAICHGLQVLNVVLGGTLIQNIATQLKGSRPHRDGASHKVYLHDFSRLYRIINSCPDVTAVVKIIKTNSFHHQAIKELGRGLMINARAEDGLIEGVELVKRDQFVIGLQWHPERLISRPEQLALFKALIKSASVPALSGRKGGVN